MLTKLKEVIEIHSATVSEEEPGIIFIRLKPGIHIDIKAIKEINNAKNRIANNRKYAVIFIPEITSSISSEARAFSSTPEVFANAICKALVTKILSHRIIGNFFIHFHRPPAPVKIFKTEEEALKWIKSQMN